jgi:ferredoxin
VDYDLSRGTRRRTWDGCMLGRFALVAGGHNFRSDVADRYRHRYYRKGKYIPEKIGELACVGCGRCIAACVAKIAHPPEIFNTLHEAAKVKA